MSAELRLIMDLSKLNQNWTQERITSGPSSIGKEIGPEISTYIKFDLDIKGLPS